MKILVTGGAGFIGSHLVDRLVKEGHVVRIFDNLDPQVHRGGKPPEYLNKNAEFINGDVTNRRELQDVIKGMDAIYHEASAVGVGQSMYEIEHYVKVNSLGTAILLDILANSKHTIRKVIIAASMSSYGEGVYACPSCKKMVRPQLRPDEQMAKKDWELHCPTCQHYLQPRPTDEEAKQNCNSIYAITKKDQEEMILTVCRAYGIPAVALRYFNVYGPRQSLSNPYTGVTAIFLSRLKNKRRPVIYEDGGQTRDFVSVHDIVDINVKVLTDDRADGFVFNVGNGKPLIIQSIAEILARLLGVDIAPKMTQAFRKGDVRHCYADISKAKKMLGWEPKVSFEEGMKELIAWSKNAEAIDSFEEASRELKEKGLG